MTIRTTRKHLRVAVAGGIALAIVAACGDGGAGGDQAAGDEEWAPTQDVVLNVPFGPGGGTDILARAMAEGLRDVRPDLRIAVENRPGSGSVTGFTWVYQREGDPHVLTTTEGSLFTIAEFADIPFRWEDFTVIGTAAEYSGVVVAQAGRFDDLPDLIQQAKDSQLSVGDTGPDGAFALTARALEEATGTTFQPVHFDAAGNAVGAVVAGDVDIAIFAPEISVEFVRSGDLEPLAVLSEERLDIEEFADVPTAKEQGIDLSFALPKGLAAPGGLSEAERAYWESAFEDWTRTDSYQQFVQENFLRPLPETGEEAERIMSEAQALVSDIASKVNG